jgi:hypothetical protein
MNIYRRERFQICVQHVKSCLQPPLPAFSTLADNPKQISNFSFSDQTHRTPSEAWAGRWGRPRSPGRWPYGACRPGLGRESTPCPCWVCGRTDWVQTQNRRGSLVELVRLLDPEMCSSWDPRGGARSSHFHSPTHGTRHCASLHGASYFTWTHADILIAYVC